VLKTQRLRRIGITLGDPRGIGPEVTRKALDALGGSGEVEFLLIGPPALVPGGHPLEDIGSWDPSEGPEGAGRLAGRAIAKGVELGLRREIDALVTAPIDKSAFHAAGWHFPGHTEMLQSLTGAGSVAMMMAAERTVFDSPLRVVLATTHIPLRAVPATLSADLLVRQSLLTLDGLRQWWGIPAPRIALCAVNPHASDGGLFGDEEARILAPALETLNSGGAAVTGPIPADTVFRRALAGEFDAVVAPYHDVGMAAFKTAAFGTGVNVTLGLPFPRTSPDHGTALDIAGRDLADPSSMIEAIRLAVAFAERFDTPRSPE
jgi:4-hydroxythreonine-4-phosphate dehydrogenase